VIRVDPVNKNRSEIDALVGKVREAIERLRELRTALISAAVTGKIDLRNGHTVGANNYSPLHLPLRNRGEGREPYR